MNKIKFNFVKYVNEILNSRNIEKRIIDVTYTEVEIKCDDFEIYCNILKSKNKILCKNTTYDIIVTVSSVLFIIREYFDYVTKDEWR